MLFISGILVFYVFIYVRDIYWVVVLGIENIAVFERWGYCFYINGMLVEWKIN